MVIGAAAATTTVVAVVVAVVFQCPHSIEKVNGMEEN